MRIGQNQVVTAVVADTSAGASDALTFTPLLPIEVVRYGYLVTTLLDNTPTALVMSLDTNNVLAAPARVERGTVTDSVDRVIGTVVGVKLAEGNGFQAEADLPLNVVVPGWQVIVERKVANVAGAITAFLEYRYLSWGDFNHLAAASVHNPLDGSSAGIAVA